MHAGLPPRLQSRLESRRGEKMGNIHEGKAEVAFQFEERLLEGGSVGHWHLLAPADVLGLHTCKIVLPLPA